MSIKVEVSPAKSAAPSYPYLGRYRGNASIIVLVTGAKTAIVLDRGDSGYAPGFVNNDGFFSTISVEPLPIGQSVTITQRE